MKLRTPSSRQATARATAPHMPCPRSPAELERIAVAAYFNAERRGFAPGGELDDWLQAETDCLAEPPRP